jgi:AraC family carnitine catabolism transcriptional activator
MERHLETPRSLAAIATACGLSQRHMERLFREHTGVTPVRYYMDVRLDRARGMITQTEMSVLQVSVACGFASPEYFARVYRRRFGLTPREDRIAGRVPFQFRSYPAHARA